MHGSSCTSSPPPPYQSPPRSGDDPNERTRLFPTDQEPEPQRKRSNPGLSFLSAIIGCTIILFVSVAAINLTFRLARRNDPLDPLVRDRIRQEWASEVKRHDEVREQWAREVENHNQAERERRQREADERLRLGMFWADLVGDHGCAAYATREYSARLTNVPEWYTHRIEACMDTPVVIHGITYKKPTRCVDEGSNGLFGHWMVDHNEPACSTFWESYKDKGCTAQGSGKRHIEQYLANLPHGADWQIFCATTPTTFGGREYKSPDHCFFATLSGAYGLWDVDDPSC